MRYSFLFLALLLPFFSISQSSYRIDLRSGSYIPDDGFAEFPSDDELNSERYYRVVQFHEIPDEKARNQIKEAGLELLEYLDGNAYTAAFTRAASFETLLYKFNLRSVFRVPARFKLHPNVASGGYPDYMVTSSGELMIHVACHELSAVPAVIQSIAGFSTHSVSRHSPKVLVVVTSPENIHRIAVTPGVSWIEPIDPKAEPENLPGRTNHRSNAIAADYAGGRHYDGSGVIVAMGDDGVIGPHIDYEGRTDQSNVTANDGNHGDHVAGTIMGAGNLNPRARGMAFGADFFVYQVWDAIIEADNSYVSPGVRITSTSYSNGCNAGYTTFAQGADQQMHDMPSLIHVFSAGNNGASDCGYGAGSGWGNVTGGVKVGKNVLAVANLGSTDVLSASSSRGPAADGRIKPEVSAVGTSVYSTVDANSYAVFSGTSMACPGTSGTLAQLYQAYKDHNSGADPDAGLMKAVLMNTADDIGNPGPDFKFGYGRINALRAARTIETSSYYTDSIQHGAQNSHQITLPPNVSELKLMLYWTDYPGSVSSAKALVNDLDVLVTDPASSVWNPWVLDPAPNPTALNSNAVRATDTLNNMEQVTLQNPVAGTYTITVDGTLVPQGTQRYFLTWEYITDSITVTYPIGGEGFVPGEAERIRWDAYGNTGTFLLEYSTNNGSSWNTISSGVAASVRSFNWAVPTVFTGQALIRVTRNGISDVSDTSFSIMPVPSGLTVDWACVDSIKLSWNPVAQASQYVVYMLGTKYMDSITASTASSVTIYNTNPLNTYWFSVSANGPLGAKGRRAIAINKAPGTFSCQPPYDASVNQVTSPATVTPACITGNSVPITVTVNNPGQNTLTNIPIAYSLNGGAIIQDTVPGPIASLASVSHTFPSNINPGAGSHQISLWVSYPGDGNYFNDSLVHNFFIGNGSTVLPGWTEDFESFSLCATSSNCELTVCGLNNGFVNAPNGIGDDIDWRTDQSGTPSNLTGPSTDHNPGTSTGNYLYLEASTCFGKKAELITPCLDLTNAVNPEFGFWYHMYGENMGLLNLDVFADSAWSLNVVPVFWGNQGDVWKQATIDLTSFAGKVITLRFRGTTGSNYTSDIAIDDLHLKENYHPGVNESTINSGMVLFPNPADGSEVFVRFPESDFEGSIQVTDITGRVVFDDNRTVTRSQETKIELNNLSSGVYFLKAETHAGKLYLKRLVIR